MPTLVIVIVGCFVGVDTGLHLRRLIAQTRSEMDNWFPVLAALAPLVTGVAIAQSTLLALLSRWPELAYTMSGPLLIIYGFVWFQNSLAESRLSPAPHGLLLHGSPTPAEWKISDVLPRIGLGMQLGLLLCAAGARDLPLLLGSVLAAVLVATMPDRIILPLEIRSTLLRGVTGALLFVIGAGAVLQK